MVLLLSLIPNESGCLPKSADFTYVHPSESVSNLDHVLVSGNIACFAISIIVLNDFVVSDHLPLAFSIVDLFNHAK